MRRMNWIGLIAFLSLGLMTAPTAAQSDSGWRVVKTESVQELIDQAADLHHITLSPDGTTLAWGDRDVLCFYTIESDSMRCYDTPDAFTGFGGNYQGLAWSPDSHSLAFTESVFDRFYDGDIWVFDVPTETFTNRTDDQYKGDLISPPDENLTYDLDYMPSWNPVNGDLYFFRSERPPEADFTLTLQLMPLTRTEPKQVADFSTTFPILSVFRPANISPDGKSMAIIVLGQKLDDPQNGLYVVNLKDGSLKHIVTVDQFELDLPAWSQHDRVVYYPETGVRWVGNDALVMTLVDMRFGNTIFQNVLYVDLASGSVNPLIDYSDVTSADALYENSDDLSSPIYRVPRAGVVTPDGSAFIYLSAYPSAEQGAISLVPLPASEAVIPVQLTQIEGFVPGPAATAPPQISDDGTRALLFGYLVTLQHE